MLTNMQRGNNTRFQNQVLRYGCVLGIAWFCLSSPILQCSRSESDTSETAPQVAVAEEAEKAADLADAPANRTAAKQAGNRPGAGESGEAASTFTIGQGLNGSGYVTSAAAQTRLLEYKVDLQIESKDLLQSRKNMLAIVQKYGFIVTSNVEAGTTPWLQGRLRVKSDSLYEVLLQSSTLGSIQAESIQVIDHTENDVLQKRKIQRSEIQQARRTRSLANTERKDWAARERLLSESEEKEDQASQERWRIQDRVSWAEVTIHINGPRQAPQISVPLYQEALIDLVNGLLYLSWLSLYLIPWALLAALLVWGLRRLWQQIKARRS
ncbi:MAG: DUF4349 domain-containing protein [Leptospiraceae bacterium]|nr:DUF4349 domain-containing protein [Leptospiraceae bacterium]